MAYKAINKSTGQEIEVNANELINLMNRQDGQFIIPEQDIPVYDPETNEKFLTPLSSFEQAKKEGLQYLTDSDEQMIDYRAEADSAMGALKTFARSAADTATFGASNLLLQEAGIQSQEEMNIEEEVNPGAAFAGDIAGTALGIITPVGPLGAAAKVGRMAGANVASRLVSKPLAAKVAAMATEAGIVGGTQGIGELLEEASMGNKNVTIENIARAAAIGAFLDVGATGVMAGMGKALSKFNMGNVIKNYLPSGSQADQAADVLGITQRTKNKFTDWNVDDVDLVDYKKQLDIGGTDSPQAILQKVKNNNVANYTAKGAKLAQLDEAFSRIKNNPESLNTILKELDEETLLEQTLKLIKDDPSIAGKRFENPALDKFIKESFEDKFAQIKSKKQGINVPELKQKLWTDIQKAPGAIGTELKETKGLANTFNKKVKNLYDDLITSNVNKKTDQYNKYFARKNIKNGNDLVNDFISKKGKINSPFYKDLPQTYKNKIRSLADDIKAGLNKDSSETLLTGYINSNNITSLEQLAKDYAKNADNPFYSKLNKDLKQQLDLVAKYETDDNIAKVLNEEMMSRGDTLLKEAIDNNSLFKFNQARLTESGRGMWDADPTIKKINELRYKLIKEAQDKAIEKLGIMDKSVAGIKDAIKKDDKNIFLFYKVAKDVENRAARVTTTIDPVAAILGNSPGKLMRQGALGALGGLPLMLGGQVAEKFFEMPIGKMVKHGIYDKIHKISTRTGKYLDNSVERFVKGQKAVGLDQVFLGGSSPYTTQTILELTGEKDYNKAIDKLENRLNELQNPDSPNNIESANKILGDELEALSPETSQNSLNHLNKLLDGVNMVVRQTRNDPAKSFRTKPREFNRAEKNDLDTYFRIFTNPYHVVELMNSGRLTKNDVQTLQMNFPSIYEEVSQKYLDILNNPDIKLNKQQQSMMKLLTGYSNNYISKPNNIYYIQQMHSQKDQEDQSRPGPKPKGKMQGGAEAEMTATQKTALR